VRAGIALAALVTVLVPAVADASPIVPAPEVTAAAASFSRVKVGLVTRMTGLAGPVFVANAGDGSNRLFVVEQRGTIRVYRAGLKSTPYLDIRSRVEAGGERGLLGLAFHPQYASNGKFYVDFTERGTGDIIVAEFQSGTPSADTAPASSYRPLLRIYHRSYANHNGGMLAFGRDGYLYIATGDGGGSGNPLRTAQSLKSRLGKILRIDVNGTQAGLAYRIPPSNPYATSTTSAREIWQRGLRNPWRFSFDRSTGDLWIGDVGQNRYEEVDRATRTFGLGRAANWGWPRMEGYACYSPRTGCSTTGLRMPLTVYPHTQGCAIIGGYVYRGARAILRGAYLFADACTGRIWSVVASGASRQTRVLMADTPVAITSFGEGENGSLYVTASNGRVYGLSATSR
jgi:glucose/arabinose dehydrogenase